MGLYKAKEVWTGTLASSIPDATTTSFTLTSSSGLTNGETYVFTIDRVDVNGTKTPNKKEVIIGTVSGSNVIDCIRGVEGTAQAHSAGAIVEILFTAKHWNDFIESFKAQHREDGTHSKIQGLDNNQAITQKDNTGAARNIAKINASNVLEIGDSNLAGQQFNTPLVNNTAIKQKDNTGTERSVLKINSSNVLEIGDSNLAGWTINGGGTTLGYAEVSTSQSGITTLTDLTGLSVSVNVPAGGRRIKITGWLPQVYSSVAGDRADFHIREGNTSLAVAYTRTNLVSDGGFGGLTVMAVLIPSAGNHTYKLSLARGLGTGSLGFYASSETKAFILVELI